MYLGCVTQRCEIRVTGIEQRRGWLVGRGHGVQAATPDESVYRPGTRRSVAGVHGHPLEHGLLFPAVG